MKIFISTATHQDMERGESYDSERNRKWGIRRFDLLPLVLEGRRW